MIVVEFVEETHCWEFKHRVLCWAVIVAEQGQSAGIFQIVLRNTITQNQRIKAGTTIRNIV
jgi:hypothetical protein